MKQKFMTKEQMQDYFIRSEVEKMIALNNLIPILSEKEKIKGLIVSMKETIFNLLNQLSKTHFPEPETMLSFSTTIWPDKELLISNYRVSLCCVEDKNGILTFIRFTILPKTPVCSWTKFTGTLIYNRSGQYFEVYTPKPYSENFNSCSLKSTPDDHWVRRAMLELFKMDSNIPIIRLRDAGMFTSNYARNNTKDAYKTINTVIYHSILLSQ